MKVEFYATAVSAPVRIVHMTLEILKIEYNYHFINPRTGDTRTPEFLKINPLHNVPVVVDGDYTLNESRAIAAYLVSTYGAADGSSLYPKDPKVRGKVDQLMYFDMGTLYKAFSDILYPVMFDGAMKMRTDKFPVLYEVLDFVKGFISKTGYAAETPEMTLADLGFVASLTTINETGIVKDYSSKYPELLSYVDRVKAQIPNYEKANGEGAAAFGQWAKESLEAAAKK